MAGYDFNLWRAFTTVVTTHGARPALRLADGSEVTYRDLHARAARIATGLAALGIGRGDVVALQNNKSPRGYATMLACLALGAAYTHLDPLNPVERLRRILATCAPALIVTDGPAAAVVAEAAGMLGLGLREMAEVEAPQALPLAQEAIGSDIAYIMFTSGSTGMPKGVAIAQASVLNFTAWCRTTFAITPEDVLCGVNPIHFDNSVFDVYASLFNGACLVPVTAAELSDAGLIVRRVDAAGCTLWFSVPSLLIYLMTMKALRAESFTTMRRIVFGGEGYPKQELARLMAMFGARASLINVYGPTECTCICSAHPVSAEDLADGSGLPPLGQIAQNCGHLILDGDCETEEGELCLHGPQLALGYYNDPERTAAAFTPNPVLHGVPGVIYRTGDLVRRAGGMLHFVGRRDNQIKHMGYRIELEEVEAAVQRLPGIIQAAVVYRRMRPGGHGLIMAHLALPADAPRDEAALRATLRETLPDYMLPNRFVFWDDLPKNANGKVDRVGLRDG